VTSRIGQLTECLDLISYKVKVYEDHVAQGTASQLGVLLQGSASVLASWT
jgi:hypothetical protein